MIRSKFVYIDNRNMSEMDLYREDTIAALRNRLKELELKNKQLEELNDKLIYDSCMEAVGVR